MRVEQFRSFVKLKHRNQKYGLQPYINHIDHVVQVANRFGYWYDEEIIMACLGHDLLEDTRTVVDELRSFLTRRVVQTIIGVTDFERELSESRLANKERTFIGRTRKSKEAVIVKMCDRIANIESCIAENLPELLNMYLCEHEFFIQILNAETVDANMWNHMVHLNLLSIQKIKGSTNVSKKLKVSNE